MGKIWRWVAIVSAFFLILGIAMIAVAYATGGSVERLMATSDLFDMTKFASREQLEQIVTQALGILSRIGIVR